MAIYAANESRSDIALSPSVGYHSLVVALGNEKCIYAFATKTPRHPTPELSTLAQGSFR